MENKILHPPLPYISSINKGTFSPGKLVRILGIARSFYYNSFHINLQCGPETQDDVAIQVSGRFLDGHISINSLQNGTWGEEQHGTVLSIKHAQKFEICLICDFTQYKIKINGQDYFEFPQRIHYNRITHLAIDGHISIIKISYESAVGGEIGPASGSLSSSGSIQPLRYEEVTYTPPSGMLLNPSSEATGMLYPTRELESIGIISSPPSVPLTPTTQRSGVSCRPVKNSWEVGCTLCAMLFIIALIVIFVGFTVKSVWSKPR